MFFDEPSERISSMFEHFYAGCHSLVCPYWSIADNSTLLFKRTFGTNIAIGVLPEIFYSLLPETGQLSDFEDGVSRHRPDHSTPNF